MFADYLEDTARIDHRRGATREAAMLAEWAFGTNLEVLRFSSPIWRLTRPNAPNRVSYPSCVSET